jgi:acyl dehydratase
VLFFEDLSVGQAYETHALTVTDEAIIRFALEYDFQPFHVDRRAAEESIFGGLIASGIQTLALSFRLCNQAQLFSGNSIAGIGFDEVRFLRPVYAGDSIRAIATVLACRPSKSQPTGGIVTWGIKSVNHEGHDVFSGKLINIIKRRNPG